MGKKGSKKSVFYGESLVFGIGVDTFKDSVGIGKTDGIGLDVDIIFGTIVGHFDLTIPQEQDKD